MTAAEALFLFMAALVVALLALMGFPVAVGG